VIYVSNSNANRIAVFDALARGNAAPVRTIEGGRTGLAGPRGLALDAAGRLYVANRQAATVTVYAPAASGNIAPLRTLHAPVLRSAFGLALEPEGGVFVSSCPDGDVGGVAAIVHFAVDSVRCDSCRHMESAEETAHPAQARTVATTKMAAAIIQPQPPLRLISATSSNRSTSIRSWRSRAAAYSE